MDVEIRIQETPLDALAEIAPVYAGRPTVGGVVSFIGLMREMNQGDAVSGMTLEHYPGMTEKALVTIVGEAGERWSIDAVRVIHHRGRTMMKVKPGGKMAVVGLSRTETDQILHGLEQQLSVAATNGPATTLISGDADALDVQARALAAALGIDAPVSAGGVTAALSFLAPETVILLLSVAAFVGVALGRGLPEVEE